MTSQAPSSTSDITRTTLAVLFIAILILASSWILRPFVTAFLWATMLVISTWPVLLSLQARLWGRRGLATAAMTVALVLILVVPLGILVGTLIGNLDRVATFARGFDTFALPPLPGWVGGIPLAGPKLAAGWHRIAEEGPAGLSARVLPFARRFLQWFIAQIGGVGSMILQFLLTVIISAVLYVHGESAARGVRRFTYRLAGQNGEKAARLAANTVRGVAMGVVVTAIVQTLIGGVGFVITSVPGAVLLTGGLLILCLAQLGPLLVMLPAVIWKFYSGDTVRGSILLVFMLIAGTIDNFLRPVLIRKGADLPLLLIFAGVIGGVIGFGIMGIFVGPVILSVTYVLLQEWVSQIPWPGDHAAEDGAAQAAASGK